MMTTKSIRTAAAIAAVLAVLAYHEVHALPPQDDGAQSHLVFDHTALGGLLEPFCVRLVHEGWRLQSTVYRNDYNEARLSTRRGGLNLDLHVRTDAERRVRTLTLLYPAQRSLSDSEALYDRLCSKQKVQSGAARSADRRTPPAGQSPAEALTLGDAAYRSVFVESGGIITISIIPKKKRTRVAVTYQDKPWAPTTSTYEP